MTVSTTSEHVSISDVYRTLIMCVLITGRPLTGEDLHKAVFAWDLDGVKRVLDSK